MVKCTLCGVTYYASPNSKRRLAHIPCVQLQPDGTECGGRLRLPSWSGFLPPAQQLEECDQ